MLLKLIKHNLKPIFKILLPFALALIISIILFNITGYEAYTKQEPMEDGHFHYTGFVEVSGLQQFLHGLFNFTTSCAIILLIAVAVRTVCHQFKINFYSDRAYLTHTLPVTRNTLWRAQFCSLLITFASVVLVLILGCFILALSKNGLQLLESFGLIGGCTHCLGEYYFIEPRSLGFYLGFVLVVFTEFVFLSLCGIAGIIIQHRVGKKYAGFSGLAIYLLSGALLLGICYFIALSFDHDALVIFDNSLINTPDYTSNLSLIAHFLLYIGSIYVIYCTAMYFVDQRLLRRGIDLD